MRQTLQRLPFLLILQGLGAAAMFVPAVHAYQLRYYHTAQSFFYSGLVFLTIFSLLAVALGARGREGSTRSQLTGLVGALVILPLMLAVPFREALGDARLGNAWFEMISSLTTTGATLYPGQGQLPPTLHLWRAMVGWMGGLLFWVSALAILAPLNLGGFEVVATDLTAGGRTALRERRAVRPGERLRRYALRLAPIYAGLTMVLWIGLALTGTGGTTGAILAMSAMSTSGIVPGGWQGGTLLSEMLIFAFLFFAVSRLTFRNDFITRERGVLFKDPEMRLAVIALVLVPSFLFLRHVLGSFDSDAPASFAAVLNALWGALFTTLSFLTTTGFESTAFANAPFWADLPTPGLLLMGLALVGGGVATTAGGVKLLRIFALYKHGAREMGRLVYPNSIGGSGSRGRRLRREGAFVAWIFFMLFAIVIAITMAGLTLAGVDFEEAMVLSVAVLSNTGPVAAVGSAEPVLFADQGFAARVILALAMVLGRLETLAIVALFNRDFWRA